MELKAPGWVYWMISTATAAFTIITFAYANFPSRVEYDRLERQVDDLQEALDHKLERLENKLDQVISNQPTKHQ